MGNEPNVGGIVFALYAFFGIPIFQESFRKYYKTIVLAEQSGV